MASQLFPLLDKIVALTNDIALATKVSVTTLDDIAAATQQAAAKSAQVVVDDLTVTAKVVSSPGASEPEILTEQQQHTAHTDNQLMTANVMDVELLRQMKVIKKTARKENAIIKAVMYGSAINKVFIVTGALFLNYYLAWALPIVLLLAGAYMSYEGMEKVIEFIHERRGHSPKNVEAQTKAQTIREAIATDKVLSLEIIAVALSVVATASFATQVSTLIAVAILATVGVYGIAWVLVKADDMGAAMVLKSVKLYAKESRKGEPNLIPLAERRMYATGNFIIKHAAPTLAQILSVVGTVAMLGVGGSLIGHQIIHWAGDTAQVSHLLHTLFVVPVPLVNPGEILFGCLAGLVLVLAHWLWLTGKRLG